MPPRAAAHLAERAGLAAWAPAPPPSSADPPADSTETKRLLHLLLTIYTAGTAYVVTPHPTHTNSHTYLLL